MGKINAQGLEAAEIEKTKRAQALHNLMETPFDLEAKRMVDKKEIKLVEELTRYMDEFEFTLNQMYIYQAMNEFWKFYGFIWSLGVVIPLPEFTNHILTASFYACVSGNILENFSLTDFQEQLNEMKLLYNWCLKDGDKNYNPQIDNTKKIANPEIQRLIKLLAPLVKSDFLIVWPRLTKPNDTNVNSGYFSRAISYATSTYSYFAEPKATMDLTKINELKTAVEGNKLDIGVYDGFKQALDYFAKNPKFKEMLQAKITDKAVQAKNFGIELVSNLTMEIYQAIMTARAKQTNNNVLENASNLEPTSNGIASSISF